MQKFKNQTQKAITARFSISDYLAIEREAEKLGSNLADVIRRAWTVYNSANEFKTDLTILENSIAIQTFNICCAVQGLNEQERADALNELKHLNLDGLGRQL